MIDNQKILGLLGLATKAGKTVFGTEACLSAIEKKKIKLLLIATDSSEKTKSNFKNVCKMNNVLIYEILDIEKLSNAIGKQNKAVIGITDANFSKAIVSIIDGGEVIG